MGHIVTLDVHVMKVTSKAVLLSVDEQEYEWISRSQISCDDELEADCYRTIDLPVWLATKKGFV